MKNAKTKNQKKALKKSSKKKLETSLTSQFLDVIKSLGHGGGR